MKKVSYRLFLMAAAAALAAGCSSVFNGEEHAMSVAEEHPISVDSQVVTLTLDVDPTTDELSNIDKARLRSFADAYLTGGHGPLTVTAPSGASGDRDGQETAGDIRRHLYDLGVDWAQMTGASYRSGGAQRQVILSYTHYVATPSACGDWSGQRARDYRNMRSPNFGCATQNNIAAMVADPRDLVEPAVETPADSATRIRMIRSYREGADTASETGDISADVSN